MDGSIVKKLTAPPYRSAVKSGTFSCPRVSLRWQSPTMQNSIQRSANFVARKEAARGAVHQHPLSIRCEHAIARQPALLIE